MTRVSRRGFWGAALRATLRAAQDVAETAAQDPDQARPDWPAAGLAGHDAIAGDFTPAMLAAEARRLGLDPDEPDRDALLAAVYEAMRARAPDRAKDSDAQHRDGGTGPAPPADAP